MKKFALVLSGCGQHDGSETHEVIMTLLALSQNNIGWDAFAPDVINSKIVNHMNETVEEDHQRSVLKEASRLVRGKINNIAAANVSNYDAIIFPGGFGAVSVLCDWVERGNEFNFNSDIEKFITQAKSLKKPMGFICIAPVLATKIYKAAKITIGNDKVLASKLEESGCQHVECDADDIVVDEINKVVSTPANMVAKNINEVYQGISKLVTKLVVLSST